MRKPSTLPLIPPHKLTDLVEQKRGANLSTCELNIYETRKEVSDFPLSFSGFTITSMLRGTKRVRFSDAVERAYVPGNTILTPSYTELTIDFPEASLNNPTQCTALTLENYFVRKEIQTFNEVLETKTFIKSWRILDNPILLANNEDLIHIYQKITKIAATNDSFKEVHIQLLLKELVLCVLKLQNINALKQDAQQNTNNTLFSAIIYFIKQHIHEEIQIEDLLKLAGMSKSSFYRAFSEELGVPPYQLIIDEKLKVAKQMLVEENLSVKETAYALGFSSANYFIRLFKKNEGLTPKQFVKKEKKPGLLYLG